MGTGECDGLHKIARLVTCSIGITIMSNCSHTEQKINVPSVHAISTRLGRLMQISRYSHMCHSKLFNDIDLPFWASPNSVENENIVSLAKSQEVT